MALKTERENGILLLTLQDQEVDSSNSGDVKKELLEAIEAAPKVVLDLRNLEFLDSSGLGMLLSCMRQVTSAGGEFNVCEVTRPVQAILELVRFHRIVDIYNTRDEAIAAFR